ncbi:helix-turn-helix transcriptional regulator [Vibrio parahaemolyticus]|nr:helix-turn-helix transcriptional regulator [Vibrio vulnificus]MDF5300174.1 helix-turn-helix transcriptional regulator [Vibrio parahaemolyticus]EID0719110.1 helix-turn-helix transcriptional regulator [Vibrio vulnificus]EID0743263.1 helix-turn-helix transcriptional regulator [Vibrio vulnificus]EJL7820148.1 helix-turn-helix transcriptional regulator [Vibrio vulnificus]
MIGEHIKALRESQKMTQEDVAKAIGIAKSTYIKYEKGTQSPQLETVEELAKLYGVSMIELITSEKPPIEDQLSWKMGLINELSEEEKKSIMLIIDGLIFRRKNLELSKNLNV